MAPRRFDIPLYYKPLTGEDPQTWINNVMARRRRIHMRLPGTRTIPFEMREALSKTIAVAWDEPEAPKDEDTECLRIKKYYSFLFINKQ